MGLSDDPRTRRQQEIVQDWEQEMDRAGTVQACTGFGKTYLSCMASKRAQEKFGESDILVIVHTRFLKEQWEEAFDEWDIDGTVEIINTAVKKYWNVDLLILDEIHRYASPIFGQIFDRVEYGGILGLTAKLPSDDKYDLIRNHCPVFAEVHLSEAQRKGWVSDFLVYNVPVDLSTRERKKYKEMNEKYHSHFSVFGHDFGLAMKCLNNDSAARGYANSSNLDYQEVKKHAVQFIRNVQKRKKMLYNLDSKIDETERLLGQTDRKTLVFSQSKEAANRVAHRRPAEAQSYHSGMTKNEREAAIDAFKDEDSDIRILSSAKALDEGADLPTVTLAVVVAGSSKPLQSIQRMGRALRKEGQRAVVVELFATNTQDEKWLQKRQRETPSRSIRRVRSVDDIFSSSTKKIPIAS